MFERLLTIRNRHSLSCSDSPIVNEEQRDKYIGYFESQHGEKWSFTCHHVTSESVLRGGNIAQA